LLYNLGDWEGRERFFDLMPVRKRVDAIVFASLVLTDAEADALDNLNVPVGMVGVDRPGWHSTRIDDEEAARSAVRHLVELGHRRIALIGGDTNDPMRFTAPHHRRVGYLDALRGAGIEYDPDLEILGYFTVDGGEAATKILLDRPERPTALFAESDEMAYGAIRAIRRAGLRVPWDVAVVGFDDHASAELLDLSTVRQPVVEQAEDLTARLLATITAPDAEPLVRVLPTELVVRGSTDPTRSVY
jgi:LacI family transcriptional regulator, repressor for deo operon, udp, cdd, tsx, nupC, and nupG